MTTPKPEATMPAVAEALAEKHARAFMHDYGIQTEPYTRSGGDHPMMHTLPAAMLAFAAALRADPTAGDRGTGSCFSEGVEASAKAVENEAAQILADARLAEEVGDEIAAADASLARAVAGVLLTVTQDIRRLAPGLDPDAACRLFIWKEVMPFADDSNGSDVARPREERGTHGGVAGDAVSPDPSPLHPHAEGNGHG